MAQVLKTCGRKSSEVRILYPPFSAGLRFVSENFYLKFSDKSGKNRYTLTGTGGSNPPASERVRAHRGRVRSGERS